VNFDPPAAEIGPVVWGPPANFNGFRVLAALLFTAATSLNGSQPNFARCLAVSSAGTPHIHCRGFLPRYGLLPGAKFTLHPPSLALSYFGTLSLEQWARAKLCGVEQRATITLGIGHI